MPQHIRLLSLSLTQKGAISGLLQEKATAEMLNPVQNKLLLVVEEVDSSIKNLAVAENWHKIKVHKVNLFRYSKKGGLALLREEIESTMGLNLSLLPQWLRKDSSERFNNGEISYSSVLITVQDIATVEKCVVKGAYFGDYNHKCEKFVINNLWNSCSNCYEYNHNGHKKCENNAKCFICAGNHSIIEHKCITTDCTAKTGRICIHYTKKCVTCKGAHFTDSELCLKRRQLIQLTRQKKSEQQNAKKTSFCEQNAQIYPNIQVIILSKSTNIAMNNDTQMDISEELQCW